MTYGSLSTLEDLQGLIKSDTQENLHLDFKASGSLAMDDKKKADISKDVSSFANSDGGTIVYGIVEADHKASCLDDGTSAIDKEWLENIITSTINPRIDGIIIHPVEIKAGSYAYIVHIPKSNRAPHQANDKRFYKRFNFKSVPMEQYEVLDVMNREAAPALALDFAVKKYTDSVGGDLDIAGIGRANAYELLITVRNESEKPAEYFVAKVYIDERMKVLWPIDIYDTRDRTAALSLDGIELNCSVLKKKWTVNPNGLVWKDESFSLFNQIILDIPQPERGDSYLLGYEISAPHMAPVKGYRAIHVGPYSIRISRNELETEREIADELAL